MLTLYSEEYGINEHITSLEPLNPDNTPDEWEKTALSAFAQGEKEVHAFTDFKGAPHLRLMRPLITEEGCLKCHAHQGYKLGDIRGGISVSLPMNELLAHEHQANLSSLVTLSIVWLLGLGSLLLGRHLLEGRISERNQAMEALEKTEARYAEAQRIARLGHWEHDLAANSLHWSEEVFRIFEKDPQSFQVSLEGFLGAIHPEDREMARLAYESSVQNRTPYDITHRLLLDDGSIKYVHERYETVYDPTGKPLRFLGTIQDITSLIEAEKNLRESEERLNLVLKGANLGMWDTDIATGTMVINDRWAEMLGYRKDEIESNYNGWQKLVHPDDLPVVTAAVNDHLEGRTPFYQATFRMRPKSGEWRWIQSTGQIVADDATGRPLRVAGIHRDITRNKELEQRVVQQERLSAVGQLTAGIAHDFNNTLTSILGFATLLSNSPEMPETARKNLEIIISSGERAAHLVHQMLDFSRKSIRRPQRLDLVPFCKEIVKFLRSAIPETIHLHFDSAPGDYLVQADPAQIQQLLTNLALNARDAMPAGGELRITLSRMECSGEIRCQICNIPLTGEWIALTVSDSGTGMSPQTLEHIFEPFYTTKEVGKGSGLGLAQVLGITRQHDGHITAASQTGQGTTVTIYLPPLMPHRTQEETAEIAPIVPGRGETILLVEDEPTVRAAMESSLQYIGYRVLTAANGREALDLYDARQEGIALVLSDMVMPDMGGAELFFALQKRNPGVRVILMSGYHDEDNHTELLQQGLAGYFQKPLLIEALSRVIREGIGGKSQETVDRRQ